MSDISAMSEACACRRPPFRFQDYDTVLLGEDKHGAEVSVSLCRYCGATWLKYLIEEPHYSRSGRWWRVEIPAQGRKEVSAETAREWVEQSAEGFAGGSFFDSQGHAIAAPIKLR
jgi:hypothetical protein